MATLNLEQTVAQKRLMDFLCNSDENQIILQGFAGTGKSFLINQLYKSYKFAVDLDLTEHRPWVFLATTHKACEVLQAQGLDAKTVHSAFCINIMDRPTGKQVNIPRNAIIIIDECSYLNYNVLEIIQSHIQHCKVIYIGDKNQLTPVGLNHAPIYYQDIDMVELTQAVRQQNAPSIADYCSQLRNAIENNLDTPVIPHSNCIIKLDKNSFDNEAKKLFPYTGDSKLLALKNNTIQKYNTLIDPHKIHQIGDKLINNSSNYYIPNNAVVTVIEVGGEHTIHGVRCREYRIHYDSLYDMYVPLTASGLSRAKKNAGKDTMLLRHMADLRKPYAQTIHKSQGSTYKDVLIYLDDLKQCEVKKDRNRLLYVAFSRATNKVYYTGDFI